MKFCPQCGKELVPGNRFCEECGYDVSEASTGSDSTPQVASQAIIQPQLDAPPPPPLKVATNGIPPAPTRLNSQKVKSSGNKNKFIIILLIIVGIVVLGAGAWYGYTYYIRRTAPEVAVADSSLMKNKIIANDIAKVTEVASPHKDSLSTAPPKVASPEEKTYIQTKKEAKAQSAAKNSKPGQAVLAGKSSGNAQQGTKSMDKPNQGIKLLSRPESTTNKPIKTVFSSNNKEYPKYKNPRNPTRFSLSKPTMIIKIVTDHFNEDKGTASVGTISIKDKSGKLIGTYTAVGKNGSNDTKNGKWVSEPKIRLEPGTYFIQDSDPSTWSKNFFGTGFVEIEGYEI